ncbi:MAG: efflux RND transporter permease subunit [Calditrichaeota bacterium]|nr:MAG: AcrB/AcrD/AcrF family protein [Calditrichota bacterium]MBL1207519.1 efflux RND transporter permease subunit [Calditrichota bacterium]NOG47351.1 efflux RND transporter permease subunit [Calditrichota bacterium]
MKTVFRFFAERQMLALLFTAMIILLGITTLIGLKRDTYPAVDFGMVNITTIYPGASPEDVERNVTNKLEKELQTVTGINKISSVSMENVSMITVVIEIDDPDQDKVKSDIREAVGRVTDFPAEVTESPKVDELKQSDNPIIEVGLAGELPYKELREKARLFEKKLKRVPGVSQLTKYGYRAREVVVEVSPVAVESYQIPLREIINAIKRRNISGTNGAFESYTSERDLVTLAQFEDPSEVEDVVVRSTFDGPLIKVKNLAKVKDGFKEDKVLSRFNGKTAISFLVQMSSNADVIETCDAIKELIETENEMLPDGAELSYLNDTSRDVRISFDVVLNNGWIGLILVLLILPIFLNFRVSFWVAMGIPVAFLGAVFLIPMFDGFLDIITLAGLILVMGIVVDDAIIISENITRKREDGDSPVDAAVNGISEVFGPVVTTVLTTFLVFAPMFFMPGIFGKYVIPIPLAISLALLVSLFEVLVALPAHLVPGLKKIKPQSVKRNWFQGVRDLYKRIVNKFLTFRYVLVLLFIGVLAASLWFAGNQMKMILFPGGMARQFYIMMELPIGTPLETTSDKVKEVEALISELSETELVAFNSRIGINVSIGAESENFAAMSVLLTPYTQRERRAEEIVDSLRELTKNLNGFSKITYEILTGGPPVGKAVSLQIVGSNDTLRTEFADSIEVFLESIAGVSGIGRDDAGGKSQVEIKINYDKLARLGLTVEDVAQNIRIAYDGEAVTSVRYGDEDVDFRVMIQEKVRRRLSYLRELLIPNDRGRLIPLKEIAWLKSGPGKPDIRHFDGERTVTIEAGVDQDIITSLEVTDSVFAHFNVDKDWAGLQLGLAGEAMETEESIDGLFKTLIIAVVSIFFLLVLLFNSFTQPIIVLMAIPFGISGVIIAFGFHDEPMSFMAMMGVIGLSGVVVNDSLVLVSHINNLRKSKEGVAMRELIAEGTADRLRSIIMTTLTTVAALLPLAYGLGGTAIFMAPMALALGWGLIFATPLTLVLIPCFFMIGQDISTISRKFNRKSL